MARPARLVAPRWGAIVSGESLPRVRCATLGYVVQPRRGCVVWVERGTWVDGRSQRREIIEGVGNHDTPN